MASRRIKKKKQQRAQIKKLQSVQGQKLEAGKAKGSLSKQIKELEKGLGLKRNDINNIINSVKGLDYNDLREQNRGSAIGSYYKQSLIERYWDLVNAGYIVPSLTEQEVYDMAPTIMEESLDEQEIHEMIVKGEQKMEKVRKKNLEARQREFIDFGF